MTFQIDKIKPEEALSVLRKLAQNKEICPKIERIVETMLSRVSIDEISSNVLSALDSLDVEDLWKNSGPGRYGYHDPGEVAWEMFEEAMAPFEADLKRYQELSMHSEAMEYCIGILIGIDLFKSKSVSEFKNWAPDAPEEYFFSILEVWRGNCASPKTSSDEMLEFLSQNNMRLKSRIERHLDRNKETNVHP